MKFTALIAALVTVILGVNAPAAPIGKVDFTLINLVGLEVLDQNGDNTFGYKIQHIRKMTPNLVITLERESMSKIVSPLFELAETSSFKNIYVYIGEVAPGEYELVQAFENKNGSVFILDMDIERVDTTALDLTHGPSDAVEKLTAKVTTGKLWN